MDEDLDRRFRAGATLTNWGIFILVAGFIGTCSYAAATADRRNPEGRGYEMGQSPFLGIPLIVGVTLIAVGQARKSNARRASEERLREANTTIEVVPDPEVPGGPFRGGMKEVPVVDPSFAATEEAVRQQEHRRGNGYLIAGLLVMIATIVVMMMAIHSDHGSPQKQAENLLMSLGLAFFPFGIGLWLAIKGMLLRSR